MQQARMRADKGAVKSHKPKVESFAQEKGSATIQRTVLAGSDNDDIHWGQKYLLADLKRICKQMLAGWLLGEVLFADRKDSAVRC